MTDERAGAARRRDLVEMLPRPRRRASPPSLPSSSTPPPVPPVTPAPPVPVPLSLVPRAVTPPPEPSSVQVLLDERPQAITRVLAAARAAHRTTVQWAAKVPPARRMIVSSYRALGFVVLTFIVVGLVSYLATGLVYYLSDSWIQPTVVSPTDQRVLELTTQLTEHANARDRLVAELHDTQRLLEMQEKFQTSFRAAVARDIGSRQKELSRLRRLAATFVRTGGEIRRSNKAYSGRSKKRLTAEYRAHLIDQEQLLAERVQMAQMAHTDLSLSEKQAELDNRATQVSDEAQALGAALRGEAKGTLNYDVLRIKQEYERSLLDADRAREALAALERSIARHDRIIESIRSSPWLRAADHTATIAFVPYDNLSEVKAGGPVYACALTFFLCHRVGKVVEVMTGETSARHPRNNETVRGQMVHMELQEAKAARETILFVGGAPLLL